ncbi:MAG: DNA translocase FtsK [Pelagibacteraceae bacterium TMED268]|nr:MAG: DNA translocase FtsK [Pelagibacteraceae bacterium TMED268]|tara:strand:+ start:7083 stop:9173 length:2091 start_codon:yes stop_codon:yes gene_type:complete
MEFKKIVKNSFDFVINRLIELLGFCITIIGLLLLISLMSYSPEDPNFIFTGEKEIKNVLGFKGSIISDIFFQSIGLTSILIAITIFITGINIFISKKTIILLENLFFTVLYSLFGSLFFTLFYSDSFWLSINGNGGFVGKFLEGNYIFSIIDFNQKIYFYFLILIILSLFLLSINFRPKEFLLFLKSFIKIIFSRKKQEKVFNEEIKETDNIFTEDNKNLKQENFSFSKAKKENIKNNKFILPLIDLLKNQSNKDKNNNKNHSGLESEFLEKILLDFGVEGKIKKVSSGPVVTLNEFEPAAGVKVSKIINLSEDIARNTSSESARISTIPGRNTVGIELPNPTRENVYLSEILSTNDFFKKDIKLPIALGKNISGAPIIGDLASMPHLLIAGTTGSGKSVCINTIILSLLYRHTPDKCKFILIDPKMLELSTYEGIPHLLCPVITEAKKAASVLGWVVKEMESRYRLMTREGVRNIDGYNSKHKLPMPFIVVIVDEMSDLMLVAGKEIENYIQKLSQMARAAGIHIIMATQRPSVDVITGTIKANFPTRISFQVTSKIDSRTILGEQGAEQLLGKGDMLFMTSANKIIRIHAPFVSENEIEKVNNHLRSQEEPDYVDEILNFVDEKEASGISSDSSEKDELYSAAVEIIKSEGKASTSFLQRKLQIGYNRAARIIDMMEEEGLVSKANHVGKRDVL